MAKENITHQDITTVLADIANAVVGQFEMESLLDRIINTTMKALHAEVCSIFLEDKEKEPGFLTCVAGSGFAKRIVGEAKYKMGEGFTGTVAKTGEEFNIKTRKDLENLEIDGKRIWRGKHDKVQWKSEKSEFRNCIALPLKIKGHILGVIKVENKDERLGKFFTSEDLTIFKTIANVTALTIEDARLNQKAEEQSKTLSSVLKDVANAVVGTFEMKTLLAQIVNITMETLHAEVGAIFLEDKEKEPGYITCVAGSGVAKNIVNVAKYKIGEGLTGNVVKYGEGYNSKSFEEHKNLELGGKKVWMGRFDKKQWPSGKSGFRNGIGLPLKIKDQILGVIKAENKNPKYGNNFTDEDLNIFKTIANVIALTIENARLHQRTEEQSKKFSGVLGDVAGAVVGKLEMKALLDQVINTTMDTLHAEVCSIFLEDKEEPGVLKCVAGSGWAKRIVGEAKYKKGEGFTGTVAKTGQEFNFKTREDLEDLEIDGKRIWKGKHDNIQWKSEKSGFRNCIALPLKIKDQILGVIKAENKNPRFGEFFTDDDLNIFRTIANVIALTIENARLHKQIEEQLKMIAAKAAHRINNQITRYDGIEIELLKEAGAQKTGKKNLLNLAKRIRETTKNLNSMIKDFRNYGKTIRLVKTLNDINKVITDEIWLAEPPEMINIIHKLDRRIPKFKFDAGRFAESIKEMLNNALRVMQENNTGTQITISTRLINTREGTFELEDDSGNEKNVLITFEDDGPGFPPNFPVFSPFYSSDNQRTGLGLATVKENIEAHGGMIKLKPKDGRGTHFEILLPIEGGEL